MLESEGKGENNEIRKKEKKKANGLTRRREEKAVRGTPHKKEKKEKRRKEGRKGENEGSFFKTMVTMIWVSNTRRRKRKKKKKKRLGKWRVLKKRVAPRKQRPQNQPRKKPRSHYRS